MKLALLGSDEQTRAIVRAAIKGGRHQVVLACDLPPKEERQLRAELPGTDFAAQWESLLAGSPVDAVLVARGPDQDLRADQLRKLVQAPMPLLVSHPVVDSMLIYFELDMIRRDSHCVMVSYLPGRWHPAIARLAELLADPDNSPLGAVEQLVFERAMADRSRSAVIPQFSRDADLVRQILGDVSRIGALGSPKDRSAYASLGVQMSGAGPVVARWSVAPVDEGAGGRLTVVGERGKAVLQIPDSDAPWRLEVRSSGEPRVETFSDWHGPAAALDRLEEALRGKPVTPDWNEAARSIELSEAVERSLVRGRTVELHNEDFTDISTFKGTMTSVGCGLLLATLGVVFVVALIGRMVGNKIASWPTLLLGVLAAYLLVQFVVRLAVGGQADDREN